MNVLILTPDAVGSTLLQRMITIYMQFHQLDRPVINLHELTNGIGKYYSPEFNQELLGKHIVKNWGYFQTLEEIVGLLGSTDHYKTSRLAHYHIRQRNDSIDQQIPFYHYLNENFYIIACRRNNVFEHALSMSINKITKKLNVYSAAEKIDTFYDVYRAGIDLDTQAFIRQLDAYRDYIKWSEQHFNISSYFNYEHDVPRIEQFILNLPWFKAQSELITWEKNFGMTFNSWNKMHYACSDLGSLMLNNSSENYQLLESYKNNTAEKHHTDLISLLSADKQLVLKNFRSGYDLAQKTIQRMVELGIVISGPPIKKQTLAEKAKIIKNFDQLIDAYNKWSQSNLDFAAPIDHRSIEHGIKDENQFWHSWETELIAL